jgi:hypothetical protein
VPVPFSRGRRSLSDGGRLLVVLGGVPAMLMTPWAALATRVRGRLSTKVEMQGSIGQCTRGCHERARAPTMPG